MRRTPLSPIDELSPSAGLRPLLLALSCGLLLAGGVLAEDEGEKPAKTPARHDTWYAEAFSRGERGVLNAHYWSKGRKFRAEVVLAGRRIVTIVNGEYYYSIDAVLGRGVAIRRSPRAVADDAEYARPFGNEATDLISAGAEIVGSETLGGRTCDVYRLTGADAKRSVCITQGKNPLPIRVTTFIRATGSTDEVNYLNWLSGFPVPDSFFEPDPRFQIERLELNDYGRRVSEGRAGPVPVLYGFMLYGRRG